MKQLSILLVLVFALLFSTFGSAQFGFDQTQGFGGGDPYSGPQQAPYGGQGFNQGPQQQGPNGFGSQGGFGPQGGQSGFSQPGFGGFESFNSIDPFASDVGGGEQLVTLKIYNTLFKSIYANRNQFNGSCLKEGGEQGLIDEIKAAYESNRPAIQEICNRYEERLASFSEDICDPAKAMTTFPAPPEMQKAAADAGVKLDFDITAADMENLCTRMAGNEIEKEKEFQDKRFTEEANRFLEQCGQIQSMNEMREKYDEQRREMDKKRMEEDFKRMQEGYNRPYQQGPKDQYGQRPQEGQQQQPYCGDGVCNEAPESCQPDCGGQQQQPFCGDGICNEDSASCPDDCGGRGGDGEGEDGGLASYNYNYGSVYFQEPPPENTDDFVKDFYGPEMGQGSQQPFGQGQGYGPPQGQPPYGQGFGTYGSGPKPYEGFGQQGSGFGQQGLGSPFGPQPFGDRGGGFHMGPFSEGDCSSDSTTLVEKMKSYSGSGGPTDEMVGAMCKRMALEMGEKFSQFKDQAELQKEQCELNILRKKTALEEAVTTCNDAIQSSRAAELIEKTVKNRCQLVRLKEQRQAQMSAEIEAALGLYEIAENTGNQVVEASALDIVDKDKEYQAAKEEKVNFVNYILGSPEFAQKADKVLKDLEERKKDLEDVSGTLDSSDARNLDDEIGRLDKAIEQKKRIVDSHKGGIFSRLGAIISGQGG